MLGKGALAVAKEPTYKKVELRQEMNIITVADSRQTGPTSTTGDIMLYESFPFFVWLYMSTHEYVLMYVFMYVLHTPTHACACTHSV